jgi:heme A synthase
MLSRLLHILVVTLVIFAWLRERSQGNETPPAL